MHGATFVDFFPLDEAIASAAVIVIAFGSDGRAGGNAFGGASEIIKNGKRQTIDVNRELTGTHG